jgi:hypothetical protein
MDDIDIALLRAWNALAPALRADRAQALLRAARPLTDRPVRPWCCALRAADTRITPELHRLGQSDQALLADHRRPHHVSLPAPSLRRLCSPIIIDWPGITADRAAHLLGRHVESLRAWMRSGVFKLRHEPARAHARRGRPVPIVWSPLALDPAADQGAGPQAHWGSLWQSIHLGIPDHAALDAPRQPIVIHHRTRGPMHRGWVFICPGLENPCGKRTDKLFLPRPVRSMFHLTADFDFKWNHTPAAARWACLHCHQIRYSSLASRDGWNLFIAHLTQGLLFGHEVKRPPTVPLTRKRRYAKHTRTQ